MGYHFPGDKEIVPGELEGCIFAAKLVHFCSYRSAIFIVEVVHFCTSLLRGYVESAQSDQAPFCRVMRRNITDITKRMQLR